MKHALVPLLLVIGAAIYASNSLFFQAASRETRPAPIHAAGFDALTEGEAVSIPLRFEQATCYALELAIPDSGPFFHEGFGRSTPVGSLSYRFSQGETTLAEGATAPPSAAALGLKANGTTTMSLLVFDLPFDGAGEDATLHVTVAEPFAFLEPFAGTIQLRIASNYSQRLSGCLDEPLLKAQ